MFNLVINTEYVTAWDIKEYVFCPVIPWIRSNFMVVEPLTKSMELGNADINYKKDIAKKLHLPHPQDFEVSIVSKKLGAVGRVDIIAGSKKVLIAEVKKFWRRRCKHFETQLKFYALLVCKEVKPVEYAYLVLGNKIMKYRIEYEDLKRIEKLIKEVREVKNSPEPPTHSPNPRQCINCWYRKYCPYKP